MRKLIGKGTFTKAYQTGPETVEIISSCPTKECYALFSQGNPFAPQIERNYAKDNAFLMPLYPKLKKSKGQLSGRGYQVYKALRTLPLGLNYHEFCASVNNLDTLTTEEKENITSLAGDVCNAIDPHDMRFEISPRNITHDPAGNLVLLDVFFSLKALQDSWR